MLSDVLTPDQTYSHRVQPLKWLQVELEERAITVVLVPDPNSAYLRPIHGAASLVVWLDSVNGQRCYRWGEPATTHPLHDPDGAARRIATWLRGGQ